MKFWFETIVHSYSQIFFSQNKILGLLIAFVTFFSPKLGGVGLLCVVLINAVAYVAIENRATIRQGTYGFNAVLLGIALRYNFEPSTQFWVLLVIAVCILLISTVWISGFFSKKNLPFLVFPFLVTYWLVAHSVSNFSLIHFDESRIYEINEQLKLKDTFFYKMAHSMDNLHLPEVLQVYFKTLTGIFFQSSILGGILISIGVLIHSRISFLLTWVGFISAVFFFKLLGADIEILRSQLAGSNFIFMAIAIGAFFIMPSKHSFLTVFLLSPVLMMLLFFLAKMLSVFQLKAYTLSFCVLVTVFLYFIHQGWLYKFLSLITIQYYSPEKSVYKQSIYNKRYQFDQYAKLSLPFWGVWKVSQGYNGGITHLEDWGNALDFVIVDEDQKTYRNEGMHTNDFYCYNKPVLAPLDGYVYAIENMVEDNQIADVNMNVNWGNTLVINHLNGLFSQVSHVKRDSFKVKVGDYVTRGTTLATCGNSGRSPEPHIHFQVQMTSEIGAKTMAYPFAYFLEYGKKGMALKLNEVPKEGALISNVETTPLLKDSFYLIPGKKIVFYNEMTPKKLIEWEVFTDAWNRTYILCKATKSVAYFVNDGTMFYCTDFEGNRHSLLFSFYLTTYRILLGYYKEVEIEDFIPVNYFSHPIFLTVQDFFAPFILFTKARYHSKVKEIDNTYAPEKITIESTVHAQFLGLKTGVIKHELELNQGRISSISLLKNNKKTTYICVS